MQRDIDDARVSLDLIPYLLGKSTGSMVRFFPPIIVVVLPTTQTNTPADFYPQVKMQEEKDADGDPWQKTTSGELGAEAFEFKQLLDGDGTPNVHSNAELWINTDKCKLVIVDGQHRAMSLLALYRNMKGWPQSAISSLAMSSVKKYYERWPTDVILQHDLSHVQLPALFCTFPELDGSDPDSIKVYEACREVFLALNKNARPVTRARNFLLDDNDLIAQLLRVTLNSIKSNHDNKGKLLKLWNIELDAGKNRNALSSPAAISSIMHLYSCIQFLLLNPSLVHGITHKSHNLWKTRVLTNAIERLQLASSLGEEEQLQIRRTNLTREQITKFESAYQKLYSRYIEELLEHFAPYNALHHSNVLRESKLRESSAGGTAHAVLFGGQGARVTFKTYLKSLEEEEQELKELGLSLPNELAVSIDDFRQRAEDIKDNVDLLKQQRTERWLNDCSAIFRQRVQEHFDDIFDDSLKTTAFQQGLIICFFSMADRLHAESLEDRDDLLQDYFLALNQFFDLSKTISKKKSKDRAIAVIQVFLGRYREVDGVVEITRGNSLRDILVIGELKPESWPVFRYLLLELWRRYTKNEGVRKFATSELAESRIDVLKRFITLRTKEAARNNNCDPAELGDELVQEIKDLCWDSFRHGLAELTDVNEQRILFPQAGVTELEILDS